MTKAGPRVRAGTRVQASARATPPRGATPGSALQLARIRLGLTQGRLAGAIVEASVAAGQQITLTASAISRWESDIFEPALRYRPFIAQALGVDPRALFPPQQAHRSAVSPTVGTNGRKQ
jgi:transcriptional regulator with XRE-family HTH domain